MPASDYDILDTWYTTGLRGTGSHDFEINDVFVPGERFFQSIGANSYHPGPLYNTMITNVWGHNVSAVSLGIARDALDSFAEPAQTKTSSHNPVPLASREVTQARLGDAEAKLTMAGSAAVYATNRIERCFRDVHMVTQHDVVGPAGYTLAGRCFLGINTNLR